MNKITSLSAFMILFIMTAPAFIFANLSSYSMTDENSFDNQLQEYENDPYVQHNLVPNEKSNSDLVEDGSWESTSSRMNRQAQSTANTRSNSNQNRKGQTEDGAWESTSSRMNRQAQSTANTRSNSNQDRREQTEDGAWESTSSRMNRQAQSTANTRSNSNQDRR